MTAFSSSTYQSEALTQSSTNTDLNASDSSTVGTYGHTEHIIERPKIIYDKANSTYVMLMHVDTGFWTGGGYSYQDGAVGWASSSKPCGPYAYHGRLAWPTAPAGVTYRSFDMGTFQDGDGTTYLLGEDNGYRLTNASTNSYSYDSTRVGLHVYKLALGKDTSGSETVTVASELAQLNRDYESPAVMMASNGSATTYYILGSPKNGWSPTDNQYASLTTNSTDKDLGQLLTDPNTSLSSMAWRTFAPASTWTYQTQTANIIP